MTATSQSTPQNSGDGTPAPVGSSSHAHNSCAKTQPGQGAADEKSAGASAPVSARRRKTRDRLLGAALSVFARHGIVGTSIEQLCEEAGMTRGAFYSNFSSIDELILELLERAASDIVSHLASYLQNSDQVLGVEPAEFKLLPASQKATKLYEAATCLLVHEDSVSWTDSLAWLIVEGEIDQYTIRAPQLRAPHQEVRKMHMDLMGLEIKSMLTHFGMRLTIPHEEFMQFMIAIKLSASREAIPAGAVAAAPVPDRGDLLAAGECYSPAEIPANSLMQPAPQDVDRVLTLMLKFVESQ